MITGLAMRWSASPKRSHTRLNGASKRGLRIEMAISTRHTATAHRYGGLSWKYHGQAATTAKTTANVRPNDLSEEPLADCPISFTPSCARTPYPGATRLKLSLQVPTFSEFPRVASSWQSPSILIIYLFFEIVHREGAVGGVVGIEGGVISGVIHHLESSGDAAYAARRIIMTRSLFFVSLANRKGC
jgi:hypothetical protein